MENMDAIRGHIKTLMDSIDQRVKSNLADIEQTLGLSRWNCDSDRLGILGFFMYLRQANALQHSHQRDEIADERNVWRKSFRPHCGPHRAGNPFAAGTRG
jgi:hypothetical protein